MISAQEEKVNHPPDQICLEGLRVCAQIGVPEEERQLPQALDVDLVLVPRGRLEGLRDEVARTIDYAVVHQRVREVAWERPRKLLETLAEELSQTLLGEFALRAVRVSVRKHILPGTQAVVVSIWRQAGD